MSSHESISPNERGADSLRRLLIVDDDRDFVEKLVAILRTGGYEAATARNSREALDAVATFDAQLAVIDLHLGDETGIELMSALKERRSDLLFIALAENADFGVAVETMRAGFDDILAKPVMPIELSAALEGASSKLALIHQRRAAEVALREGETRFGAVCETSAAPTIITRLSDDTVIFANDACARLLGVPSEELTGFHAPDMWHDQDDRKAVVDQIRRDGSVRNIEHRMKCADGSIRWVLGSAELRTIDGEEVLIVGLNDITERKRAEHEAAQAYAQLTDSIECIPDGFALYDADDLLVWCNERYREVYPKHADIIVPGSSFEDMLRDGVARGEFSAAIGREEEWIAERLRSHADPLGPIEQELADGRWLRVEERRTREGGTVGLRTDITALKRAERSAADAKARLSDAIESISDGFILYDAEERLVLCNRKYRELNPSFQDILVPGVPLENVIRASAASEGAPLEIDDIDSWTRMRLEEYRAGTGSREILHADGRWILASERRMRNGGMVGIRIDISEIKRAMEAIRLSEEKFSKAFRAGPDSIVITRMSDGIIIDSNDRFLSRVGHTLEDIVGRPMSNVVTWVNPEDRASLMDGIATTGECTDLEADFRYVDGRLVNCLVTARTIEVEGEMCALTITRDISERKRTENILRENEQRLRDYAESSADWFWEMDSDLSFTYLSPNVERILGVAPEWHYGKTREDLLGDVHNSDAWNEHLKALREHRAFRNFEYFRVGNGVDPIWLRTSGVPVFAEDGAFLGYRGTGSDITERKQAEERLRQAQKMEAVGQLTGGIAHDFNNLLAIILGNAEMLKEGLGDDRMLAENVILAANRGGELTHQLLAFSRRQPLSPRLTNFDELVAGMTDMLRRTLGETIEIETKSTPKLWQTEVDPGQSENAVLNLAINARDAMADGGVLLIETANINISDPLDSEAAGVEPGDYVMLAVTDSGVGVAPDVLEHVFEPFFTTKEVGQGSGLGLSMVYGFANQSGGYVSIDSEIGRGTTVKVFLPRAWTSDQWAERQLAGEEPLGRGESVLLVEDETGVRTLTATLLGRLGYAVIEARDGGSAVATLESDARVDLLLTDVVLPGAMSGPKIAEEARLLRSGIKVLFMSGYPDQILRSNGPLVRGAEVLRKPFGRIHLAQKVRNTLDVDTIADPRSSKQGTRLPLTGSPRDRTPPT